MTAYARVLIVDDEEVVRHSEMRVLASEFCEVKAVADGVNALRAMEARPYDIVLLDLRMPGQDGLSVLSEMRQRWPETEVIVITGFPSVDTATEGIRLGARDYLAKPLEPAELLEATTSAIEHKQWALRREYQRPHAHIAAGGRGSAQGPAARRTEC